MSIRHTAHVTLSEPSEEIHLEAGSFRPTDPDNQACAKVHQGRPADAGPTNLNDHT